MHLPTSRAQPVHSDPAVQVAGAAAEAGLSLSEVAAEAREAASRVGSMGVALSTCSLPGAAAPARLGPTEIEMGLGIHGEPGAAVRGRRSPRADAPLPLCRFGRPAPAFLPLRTRGEDASACGDAVAPCRCGQVTQLIKVDDIVENLVARRAGGAAAARPCSPQSR